ncbi:hypothetical protein [Shewanella aegiceratis]|uniref:hypothetical protein n=1 Tax=Shewanella aegiceratis TaxID=2864203 RepID=UPI001C65A8F8|nr:hypothetical protein [Shewanella aegiceratis]QYJ84207.1 hypothetical protein K0H80_09580 [Shewanella aegiceratis]
MHNRDIQELLDHAQNEISSISEQSRDGTINKVALKNTLENLRSVLDYAAQDMQCKLKSLVKNRIPEKVYFPYGQRENHFKNSVKRNLPGLSEHMPSIYTMVQAMQPFKSCDPWLVDLCGLTNDAKHNNLNKTENRKSRIIFQGGMPLVEVGEGAQVSMTGTRVNGVLQDDVFIDPDGTTRIRPVSGQTLITENNRIHFQGKEIEVVPFLEACYKNLSKFVDDLAKELDHA